MPRDYQLSTANYSNWYLGRAGNGLSTGTVVKASAGKVFGVFVASMTVSATLALADNATGTATGTVIGEFSAGTPFLYTFAAPIVFNNGISIVSSGSVNLTVFYE